MRCTSKRDYKSSTQIDLTKLWLFLRKISKLKPKRKIRALGQQVSSQRIVTKNYRLILIF